MRKAIATFGIGPHRELLTLVMPTFIDYAGRHNYEVIVGTGESAGRPPSWGKVLLLQRLLRDYDFVLWIDADAVIIDGSVDLARIVPQTAFHALALVGHGLNHGPLPCCGVWALRSTPLSQRFLSEVWAQDDLIEHPHWEQAAAHRALGWTEWPYRKVAETQWDDGTHYLPEAWDMMPICPIGYSQGFIRHYAGMSNAQRLVEIRTDLAGMAASRETGASKVSPLLRYQLGRLARVPEIEKTLKRARRSMIGLIGVRSTGSRALSK